MYRHNVLAILTILRPEVSFVARSLVPSGPQDFLLFLSLCLPSSRPSVVGWTMDEMSATSGGVKP